MVSQRFEASSVCWSLLPSPSIFTWLYITNLGCSEGGWNNATPTVLVSYLEVYVCLCQCDRLVPFDKLLIIKLVRHPMQMTSESHALCKSEQSLIIRVLKGPCYQSNRKKWCKLHTNTLYFLIIIIVIVFYQMFGYTMSGSWSLYQVIVKQLFHCICKAFLFSCKQCSVLFPTMIGSLQCVSRPSFRGC